MSDPAEDDIVQVMEITGLASDRDLIISALKVLAKKNRQLQYIKGSIG